MMNQQLLDYINQQSQQGTSYEQIRESLIASGWQSTDIEEAFNLTNKPTQSQPLSSSPNNKMLVPWKIITILLIGLVIAVGGIFAASKTFFKQEEVPEIFNDVSNQLQTNEPEEMVALSEQSQQKQPQNPEIIFAEKLSSCTKYKTTFKHLLTGETLEKEVLGVVNGKCNYIEQMPNGGKMECAYSESERIAVAQYYIDVAMAESVGTSLNADLGSGEQKTSYTIDGKVVDNPLQEATNNGSCVISGY